MIRVVSHKHGSSSPGIRFADPHLPCHKPFRAAHFTCGSVFPVNTPSRFRKGEEVILIEDPCT